MNTLLLDIETSPNLAYTFQVWQANIRPDQLVIPGDILCFASEWLEKPYKAEFHAQWTTGGAEAMIQRAWELLDEADAVIHYNGRKFDIPWLNAAFYEAGLTPPSPFKQIDLLQTVRRQFSRLPSKKLSYVLDWSGLPSKLDTGGFKLWRDVIGGDSKAQKKMERYNRADVRIMRELYYRLLPWASNLPNANLFADTEGFCPRCGKDSLQKRGTRPTNLGLYQRYCCSSCGGWSTSGKSLSRVDTRMEN